MDGLDLAKSMVEKANVVFWDFDGVIKDSVDVKTLAFESLFLPFGRDIANRVKRHHESNGGVSRFEKIQLYLNWSGLSASEERMAEFCKKFSALVYQAVIDSPWVPGVRKFLDRFYEQKYFVLVSATPHAEIDSILSELNISHCFREIYGAPTKKTKAIESVLSQQGYAPSKALMIGDAETDLLAAEANCVPFLLRRTRLNLPIQAAYIVPMFERFYE